jgi:hypothetical protein
MWCVFLQVPLGFLVFIAVMFTKLLGNYSVSSAPFQLLHRSPVSWLI